MKKILFVISMLFLLGCEETPEEREYKSDRSIYLMNDVLILGTSYTIVCDAKENVRYIHIYRGGLTVMYDEHGRPSRCK